MDRLNNMAVLIQKIVQGYVAFQHFDRLHKDCFLIQSRILSYVATTKYCQKQAASIALQCFIRCALAVCTNNICNEILDGGDTENSVKREGKIAEDKQREKNGQLSTRLEFRENTMHVFNPEGGEPSLVLQTEFVNIILNQR